MKKLGVIFAVFVLLLAFTGCKTEPVETVPGYPIAILVPADGTGTFTVTANGNTVSNGQKVEADVMVLLTATPAAGYEFKNFMVGGISVAGEASSGGSFTHEFQMKSATTVAAVFGPPGSSTLFTLAIIPPTGGGALLVESGGAAVDNGAEIGAYSTVQLTATPESGDYKVKNFVINGKPVSGTAGSGGVKTYSFLMTNHTTVSAVFGPAVVEAAVIFEWDYLKTPMASTIMNGAPVSTGYGNIMFDGFNSYDSSTNGIPVDANAIRLRSSRVLTIGFADGIANKTALTSSSTHIPGVFDLSRGEFRLTIDYRIIDGYVEAEDVSANFHLRASINNNTHIAANSILGVANTLRTYTKYYELRDGMGDTDSLAEEVAPGRMMLTFRPEIRYADLPQSSYDSLKTAFIALVCQRPDVINYRTVITGLKLEWLDPVTYNISTLAVDGGSVSTDKSMAIKGGLVIVTANPDPGNRLDTLTVSGASGSVQVTSTGENTVTFIMPGENVNITASFAEIPPEVYTITIDDKIEGGSVSVDITETTAYEVIAITADPDPGKALNTLSVSGASGSVQVTYTGENTATFIMPEEDVIVTAVFSDLHTITIDPLLGSGTVSSDKVIASVSKIVTLTLGEKLGYISVEDSEGEPIDIFKGADVFTYTFSMPDSDVFITVTAKTMFGWDYEKTPIAASIAAGTKISSGYLGVDFMWLTSVSTASSGRIVVQSGRSFNIGLTEAVITSAADTVETAPKGVFNFLSGTFRLTIKYLDNFTVPDSDTGRFLMRVGINNSHSTGQGESILGNSSNFSQFALIENLRAGLSAVPPYISYDASTPGTIIITLSPEKRTGISSAAKPSLENAFITLTSQRLAAGQKVNIECITLEQVSDY